MTPPPSRRSGAVILTNGAFGGEALAIMHRIFLPLFLLLAAAAPTSAGCFADYKAKQDNPLRLQYGVAEIRTDCTMAAAEAELRQRLTAGGWQLLTVLGLFDESGLEERRDSAGRFYLRF